MVIDRQGQVLCACLCVSMEVTMSRTLKDKPFKYREYKRRTKERHLSKHLCIGVGGVNCPCCFPGPNSRKEVFRSAKRKDNLLAFKDAQ